MYKRQARGSGRAFDLYAALMFAGLIGAVLTVAAALNAWAGDRGLLATAAVAGLADAHSAAVAAASMVAAGTIQPSLGVVAVLTGLSTNAMVKAALSIAAGGRAYAMRIIPGLVLMMAAAWLGILL